jgi:uncharacterized protein DUF5762
MNPSLSARAQADEKALERASEPVLYPAARKQKTVSLISDDPFWGDNPAILLERSRLLEFFPSRDQNLEERMNSVTRLVIYVGIFLSVYHAGFGPIQVAGILVAVLYAMWRTQTVTSRREAFNGELCTMPTIDNPMMNHLPLDPPDKPAACRGRDVQAEAAELLDYQLFQDVDDLFARRSSQRQFITNPVTENIPDTKKLASWLHNGVKSCKGDNFCAPYVDLRGQRQLIPEDIDPVGQLYDYGA